MQKTGIEWCDSTWNPITGCMSGCAYCYAKGITKRFGGHFNGVENTTSAPKMLNAWGIRIKEQMMKLDKNNKLVKAPFPYGFFPTFHEYRLGDPLQHAKPQRIFVCSMADLFGPWVPQEWILQVFAACKKAPQHKYMFLTKYPARYYELLNDDLLPELPNFFYGTTVNTNNPLNNPFWNAFWVGSLAYHTFLSIEPILGDMQGDNQDLPAIFTHDLMIFGAETGNRMNKVVPKIEWIQPLIDECKSMGVSVFMKESLLPIMGEDNMLRQMPEGLQL